MGLADIQRALAQLYTDEAAREAFWAERNAACAAWGLSPEDTGQLAKISREEVEQFAASLLAKRRNEITKLLPLTHEAYGKRCNPLFREYAKCAPIPSGSGKHREDAARFASWLAQWIRANDTGSWWIGEMASYEAARLAAIGANKPLQVRFFRISPGDFPRIPARAKGEIPTRPRMTLAVWYRAPWSGGMRHFLLTLPFPAAKPLFPVWRHKNPGHTGRIEAP